VCLLSWTTGLLDGREKAEDSMELLDGRELDRAAGTRWSCWMGKRWTGLVVDERAQAVHSMKLLNGAAGQADHLMELLDRRDSC